VKLLEHLIDAYNVGLICNVLWASSEPAALIIIALSNIWNSAWDVINKEEKKEVFFQGKTRKPSSQWST